MELKIYYVDHEEGNIAFTESDIVTFGKDVEAIFEDAGKWVTVKINDPKYAFHRKIASRTAKGEDESLVILETMVTECSEGTAWDDMKPVLISAIVKAIREKLYGGLSGDFLSRWNKTPNK
jgi:hypothetical protein